MEPPQPCAQSALCPVVRLLFAAFGDIFFIITAIFEAGLIDRLNLVSYGHAGQDEVISQCMVLSVFSVISVVTHRQVLATYCMSYQ